MNLVCDEAVPKLIVDRLRQEGHDVIYIAESEPGIEDPEVLSAASDLQAPLVTIDKDFGELTYRQGLATGGVILVRLSGLSDDAKAAIVAAAIRDHCDELLGAFTVISPGRLRIRRRRPPE